MSSRFRIIGSSHLLIALLLIMAGLACPTSGARASDQSIFSQRMEAYMAPRADGSKCAEVKDFRIQRDIGVLNFSEGRFYLCQPINGVVPGVIFSGKGEFILPPANETERRFIYNEKNRDSVVERFEYAFLAATDSLFDQLNRELTFGERKVSKLVKRDQKIYKTFLTNSRGGQFYVPYISCMENGVDGFFFALFGKDKLNPRVFAINPFMIEKVSYREREVEDWEYGFKTVSWFLAEGDTLSRQYQFDRDTCIINGEILKKISYAGTAELRFSPIHHSWRCLPLFLFEDLEIDSVYTPDGTRLPVHSVSDRPARLVELDQVTQVGQLDTIIVAYHGFAVYRDGGYIAVRAHYDWYPKLFAEDKAHFDLTFTCPDKLSVISEGKRDYQVVGKGKRISRWLTQTPIDDATFNVGDFYEESRQFKDGPEIRFFARGAAYDKPNQDAIERMAGDFTQATMYYKHILGSCPYDTLTITQYGSLFQMPHNPGLIHLPDINFILGKGAGESLLWRLDMAARQWFGNDVDARTYHDYWILQGIVDYLSLLLIQQVRGDEEFFREVLINDRDDAMHQYFNLIDKKKLPAPMIAGYRGGDYQYSQRAMYVFHMLRMMLQESSGDEPQRFYDLLRTFYESCADGYITTEGFEQATNDAFGFDMSWFFDQWVRGWHTPEYEYAKKIKKNDEGKYVVSLRVADRLAPENFRAIVPILLKFKDGRFAELKIMANGPLTEVSLPPVTEKPEDVVFNNMEGVLCRVSEVKW